MSTKPSARLFYLDNLKVFLTILVVLYHVATAYGGDGDGGWGITGPVVDGISLLGLSFLFFVIRAFFLSAFFLIAGYFAARSYDNKGAKQLFIDRSIRLGIPIVTLYPWWLRLFLQLWFILNLFVYTVIYILYRLISDRRPPKRSLRVYPDRFPPNATLILSIVVLALLTFIVRLKFNTWHPGHSVATFVPGYQVYYIFSFCTGILAQRGDWFNRLTKRQGHQWGIVSLIVAPSLLVLMATYDVLGNEFQGGMHWQSLVFVIWETTVCISLNVFLLYVFRERLNSTGPIRRFLAKNAYAVYIFHSVVLVGVNLVFVQVNMPAMLKFLTVSLITIPLSFLLSSLIRRIPYATKVLG